MLRQIHNIGRKARNFIGGESGMTLPMLAMSMTMITGMVGLAIDVGRAQLVQAKLQFSLDAAGLAAGSTVNTSSLQTEVNKYLAANFNGYLGATVSSVTVTANDTNTEIELDAEATMPTTFLAAIGRDEVTLTADSQVTRAITGLELIMVLDNTGSMINSAGGGVSKMTALKAAATTLVNTLFGGQDTAEKLWVGIVPFAQAVNVGASHADWTDTTADAALDWGVAPNIAAWAGCVRARDAENDVIDNPPQSGNSATLFRKYNWSTNNSNCWKKTRIDGSMKCSSTGTDATYYPPYNTMTRGPNYLCSQEVTRMTNTKATLTTAINAMTANGNTLVNQGLLWGWNMISPRWRGLWGGIMDANSLPLDYGTSGMNKAVVLVTDGDNTISSSIYSAYGYLSEGALGTTSTGTAVTTLNDRTAALCTAMKAQGIYIYVIALGTDLNTTSRNMLQACATAENYYFYAPSTTQLQSIFSSIGDSLSNLRVSR